MKEGREYTFTWLIENYSYCWHKTGQALISPEFTAGDDLEGTVWYLKLYPRGQKDESKGNVSLFLRRSEKDDGPEILSLKYELSILASDGSTLACSDYEFTFKVGIGYGTPEIALMKDVLVHRQTEYCPQDCLRVRCKIWKGEGDFQKVAQIDARSRIRVEHISFPHLVEDFSTLEPGQKKSIQIMSLSKRKTPLISSLYFSDDSCCGDKIMVQIRPSGTNQILLKCKLFLIDATGKKIECGEIDSRVDVVRKDIKHVHLSFTRQFILNNRNDYLPDDKLSLSCECTLSNGVEYERIEGTIYENSGSVVSQIDDEYVEKLSECPSVLDDFKSIYINQYLTDVELKTNTSIFRAHKIVLCARSSVFKATLTNDMKEKNTGCIQVDDLESDIVQQLLIFLYSDSLENLHWESAVKLYYAGDKYAVEKLKVDCSSFLIENLSISTASELIQLADTHNDCNLMRAVEDFIFRNEKRVYCSDEWEKLMETNPRLVSKTMLEMHMRKI